MESPSSEPPILRKLTQEQARAEQRLYASKLTMEERLAITAALRKRLLLMRGIDLDEQEIDFTPSRVPRPKR